MWWTSMEGLCSGTMARSESRGICDRTWWDECAERIFWVRRKEWRWNQAEGADPARGAGDHRRRSGRHGPDCEPSAYFEGDCGRDWRRVWRLEVWESNLLGDAKD